MSRGLNWNKVIRHFLDNTKKFDKNMKDVKNITLGDGFSQGELNVTKDHLNADGHLHMGLTTMLVDSMSNSSLLAHGTGYSGLSMNIHVSCVKPTLSGDVLSIRAKVIAMENKLAYAKVEISKRNTTEIVAYGHHIMMMIPHMDFTV